METVTRAERRLAAVLAAVVPGYSRLMGADEEGTHARLRAHLREFIENAWIAWRVDIANHRLARFSEARALLQVARRLAVTAPKEVPQCPHR